MSQQNIREYNYRKWYIRPFGQNLDVTVASDERNYNEEVVFSTNLIAQNDGNRLPISFDLNNSGSSQLFILNYGIYNSANTLVSLNYYNPNNENLDMFTDSTLCDIGLTGIDNGLVDRMSGETILYTMGLLTGSSKFDRYSFDRRLKLIQVTGYTGLPNQRFTGNTATTIYEVVSKTNSQIGTYNQLYGGFYQGFFKLFGYDYETFPNRTNKGWSVEMLLKPRLSDEFEPTSGETTLNLVYPKNKNTFFYFGARGENKFYHHASGSPESDSGYTRVTQSLEGQLKTCACYNTGVTNSRCIEVYNPIEYGVEHNIDCNCYCSNNTVINADKDPLYDSMSNALSLRLSGDPSNPKVCVKVLKFTGDCIVTGTTPTTGITYQTGYTVTEYCSESNIYDYCNVNGPDFLTEEHWVLIDSVWERNTWFDTCDLYYRGGLGLITDFKYVDSLSNNTVNLIEPPVTHTGSPAPAQVEIVNLNERWLVEKSDRLGSLKIYVNSKLFYVINGFEEIIPRGLNAEKEKQLGVPFNISWGGGTQGLRESLTFTKQISDYTIYYSEWSSIGTALVLNCTPVLSGLTMSTTQVSSWFIGVTLLGVNGIPISSLGVTTSSVDDTDLFSTNSNGVVTSFSDCSETPTPTVCVGNKYIIKNDTGGDITIIGLTSPFTNTVYPSFTISSSTILVACSCTSPNVGAGKLTNVGLCSPTTQIPTSLTGLTYIQDPEVMPNQTLSGTSLSALTTNILIEPNFAGTFDGGISQFRMYVEPLNASEIVHNFDLLKTKFQMFDPRCPNCMTGNTIV